MISNAAADTKDIMFVFNINKEEKMFVIFVSGTRLVRQQTE